MDRFDVKSLSCEFMVNILEIVKKNRLQLVSLLKISKKIYFAKPILANKSDIIRGLGIFDGALILR